MSLFYIVAGINHFINLEWYLRIVPPILSFKTEIVFISGIFEIILGSLILFSKTRFFASWGLILLLLAIFPANIYVAFSNGDAMNITPLMAWVRLPFQFVFIGIAYWHSKV